MNFALIRTAHVLVYCEPRVAVFCGVSLFCGVSEEVYDEFRLLQLPSTRSVAAILLLFLALPLYLRLHYRHCASYNTVLTRYSPLVPDTDCVPVYNSLTFV